MRYAGLVASILMAAGAYAVGALPGADPGFAMRAGSWELRHVAGLAVWLAGAVLLATVWWRLRAATLTPRWVVVTGALWALPLVVAPPLGSRDVYAYACQGAVYASGHDPYTTGAAGGGCRWLEAVPELWHDTPAPYGPLAILTSAAAGAQPNLIVAVGILRAVALIGITIMMWYGYRLARSGQALWLGAVTPVVLVHGVSGAHNDVLMAGLIVASLALAAHRPTLAGAALGLAMATKATALVALPFAALLICVDHGQTRDISDTPMARLSMINAVRIVGAAVGVYAGLSLAAGLDLGWVRALGDTGSLVQWTSPPTGVGMAVGYGLRAIGFPQAFDGAVAVARILGLAVLAAVLVLLWRRAVRDRSRTVACCGAALAATTLLSPVFYPWYAIAPLAVLAFSTVDEKVRRWLAVATVVLGFLVLPSGLGIAVLTKLPGALLDVVILALLARWWLRRRPTTT